MMMMMIIIIEWKKDKMHPRTGHEGLVGEWKYSYTLSLTSAAMGVSGWSTPRPGCFTPGNDPVLIVEEAGWVPGPSGGVRKISYFTPGDRPPHSESLYRLRYPGPQ